MDCNDVSIIGVYTDWDFMLSRVLEYLLNEKWDLYFDETDHERFAIFNPRLPTDADELIAIFKRWSNMNYAGEVRVDEFTRSKSIEIYFKHCNDIYYIRKTTLDMASL